jgi:hypothetical protein
MIFLSGISVKDYNKTKLNDENNVIQIIIFFASSN